LDCCVIPDRASRIKKIEEKLMAPDVRLATRIHADEIRMWQYGNMPLPDWMPAHIVGDIAANGTFEVVTEFGHVRVHPGNAVIERCGTVWVCPVDETPAFVKTLKQNGSAALNNIGPGKASRFGARAEESAQRPRYAAPIGCLPSIEWIHIARLSIDSTYQRSTENAASRRLIASIAAKFDWRLCSPLVVSRRADDVLTIIDGQHRWEAACRREDIPQLPCCVFRYEDMKEEARMFIVANRARKPINRMDDYYAALAAADEDALEIDQLVKAAGFTVSRTTSSAAWGVGEIAFTSAISKAIRRFGMPIASAALTTLALAFPNQRLMHGGAIFGALVLIMSKPGPDFDPDRLLSTLTSRRADEWSQYVTGIIGGNEREAALRTAITQAYEKSLVQAKKK
jgi:hypothetical protein